MDHSSENIEIGYIGKAHGLRGEVYLRLHAGEIAWNQEPKSLNFKCRDGRDLNMQIESYRIHKDGLILKLQESVDRNFSDTLVGAKVYLPKDFYSSEKGDSPYYHELMGVSVFDTESLLLGVITRVVNTGQQDVIEISKDGSSFMAPFVNEFIKSMDLENKKLVMELPEGLEDLE